MVKKILITFIENYSQYVYLCMLRHKSEALEAFKIFKTKVKKQHDKKIKIVRIDKGCEYYGRYHEDNKYLVHLLSLLKITI